MNGERLHRKKNIVTVITRSSAHTNSACNRSTASQAVAADGSTGVSLPKRRFICCMRPPENGSTSAWPGAWRDRAK